MVRDKHLPCVWSHVINMYIACMWHGPIACVSRVCVCVCACGRWWKNKLVIIWSLKVDCLCVCVMYVPLMKVGGWACLQGGVTWQELRSGWLFWICLSCGDKFHIFADSSPRCVAVLYCGHASYLTVWGLCFVLWPCVISHWLRSLLLEWASNAGQVMSAIPLAWGWS